MFVAKKLKILSFLAAAGLTGNAFADSAETGYIGAFGGIDKIRDADGVGIPFGVELGLKFAPEASVGIYDFFTKKNDVKFMEYGLTGDYYFTQAPGVHAGLNLGLESANAPVVGTSTHFGVGPKLGYDYAVMPALTIGAQVDYNFYFSTPKGWIFHALAAVKYWF